MKIPAALLLMGITSFMCLGQGVVIPDEYWIEPNTKGLDSGTAKDPFYGNSQASFDRVMSALVTKGNVVVH